MYLHSRKSYVIYTVSELVHQMRTVRAAVVLADPSVHVYQLLLEHEDVANDEDNDIGQGLNSTTNATRLLCALGIEHDFLGVADVGQTC